MKKIKKIIYRDYFKEKIKIRDRRGLKFLLRYGNYIDRKLILHENYENQQLDYLVSLINRNNVRLFFDIGANFGLYSLTIANKCDCVEKIFSYEPDIDNYYNLCGNIFVNGFTDKISAERIGVSDKHAKLKFLKNLGNSSGTSRILDTAPSSTKKEKYKEVEINVAPLDELINILNDEVVALKIDVEGHEIQVLNGAKELLKNNKCILQIEILDGSELNNNKLYEEYGLRLVNNIESDYYFTNCEIHENS